MERWNVSELDQVIVGLVLRVLARFCVPSGFLTDSAWTA
jgi:hypothetical protein